jgi:hypothetical protein
MEATYASKGVAGTGLGFGIAGTAFPAVINTDKNCDSKINKNGNQNTDTCC